MGAVIGGRYLPGIFGTAPQLKMTCRATIRNPGSGGALEIDVRQRCKIKENTSERNILLLLLVAIVYLIA
jgi:hypothetical protein